MKPINNVHDMRTFTSELKNSYASKRELYFEYNVIAAAKSFNYTKAEYVREKFPRFPLTLRKQISEFI